VVIGHRVLVCWPRGLIGGVELGGDRVVHTEGFLRGRRPLRSLMAVWFCAKASLCGRRPLCSLMAAWFCAKASLCGRRPLCSLMAVYLGMVGTFCTLFILNCLKIYKSEIKIFVHNRSHLFSCL